MDYHCKKLTSKSQTIQYRWLHMLLVVTSWLVINALPALSHGGDEEEAVSAVATSSNISLLGFSVVLAVFVAIVVTRLNSGTLGMWLPGIAFLGSLAAFIHFGLGFRGDLLLLLNGVGYLGLLLLLLSPISILAAQQEKLVWVFIIYTGITIIGYFAMHSIDAYSKTGLFTKGIEVGLIATLLLQLRFQRSGQLFSSISSDNVA